MSNEIDEAVDYVLGSGLATASESDVLRQLDAELQQQTQARALVLSSEAPSPWVLGGEGAGGFGSMAQRFLNTCRAALRRELCEMQGGLKQAYRESLSSQDTREQITSLVPTVMTAIGKDSSLINPLSIAAMVALWLLKIGLDQWCVSLAPEAETTAPGAAAAAMPPGAPASAQPAAPPTQPGASATEAAPSPPASPPAEPASE